MAALIFWICSDVVKEIHQNGMSFDNFASSGDSFNDFDKYFNFGKKFSASTNQPIVKTVNSPSPMSEPTKPWKKPYSSDVVPGKKFKRNYPRQKDNKYKQNTDVHTKKIDSQMPLQELKIIIVCSKSICLSVVWLVWVIQWCYKWVRYYRLSWSICLTFYGCLFSRTLHMLRQARHSWTRQNPIECNNKQKWKVFTMMRPSIRKSVFSCSHISTLDLV